MEYIPLVELRMFKAFRFVALGSDLEMSRIGRSEYSWGRCWIAGHVIFLDLSERKREGGGERERDGRTDRQERERESHLASQANQASWTVRETTRQIASWPGSDTVQICDMATDFKRAY